MLYLEREYEEQHLYAEVASINKVSQENVFIFGRVLADLDDFHEVVVLAVDVAHHSDGVLQPEEVALLGEDLLDEPYNLDDVGLGDESLLGHVGLQHLPVWHG